MIKDKARKEICLLLILTLIASLTSSQAVYAAKAEIVAVNAAKAMVTENSTGKDLTVSDFGVDALNIVQAATDGSSEPSASEPGPNGDVASDAGSGPAAAGNPVMDDADDAPAGPPAAPNATPALNTESLKLIAGGNSYELHVENAASASYGLSAEGASIVALSNEDAKSVTITPKAPGHAVLSVAAVGVDGSQTVLPCQIDVSELTLSEESVEIYMNDADHSADVEVQGVDWDLVYYGSGHAWEDESIRDAMAYGTQCSIRAGNDAVADAGFSDGSIHIRGVSKGVTNIKITIFGRSLSIRVTVYHYTLNKYTINTYKGSSLKSLKLRGAGNHKVTWVSGNRNVASVSNTGIVTINGIGTTKITAKVNSRKVVCIVSVSSKTAYRVVKDAREISQKKNIQYSQAMRMSQNYYDCSSLVYRCYRAYGIRFGYTDHTWAPTAADEARWCASSNHLVSSQPVDILSCKLVPGDTIFYSFNENNGRYLNIDHTAIFAGYAYDASIGYYGTIIEASSSKNTVAERMYFAGDSTKLIGRPSKK